MAVTGNDPSILRDEVKAMQNRAEVCNALLGGTPGMRAKARTYLPQEPAETPKAYSIRLSKATLFPAFKKALGTMTGKPFGTPIALGDDVPDSIKAAAANIDLAGRDLDTFARDVFQQTLSDGIGWILVDYQNTKKRAAALGKETLSLAEERAMGVRPYLIHIPLANLLGWKSEIVDGIHRLTQFRFKEAVESSLGMFGIQTVTRIRVWEIGKVSVYIQSGNGKEWTLVPDDSGPVTLTEIPVVTCYTGRTGYMTAEPPLEDLAWLNVEHYQSRSDQRHVLHIARVPLLFAKMLEKGGDGTVIVGSNRLIVGGDADSDLKYVEHTGAAIDSGRQEIIDLETAMRAVAGEMVASEVEKTATEIDRDAGTSDSQLKKLLKTFQNDLNGVLRYMALWTGEKTGGTVTIALDWDDAEMGADLMVALTNSVNSGVISKDTAIWNFKRKGLLPPGRTVEQEKALVEHESPMLGGAIDSSVSAMDRLKARAAATAKSGDGVDALGAD